MNDNNITDTHAHLYMKIFENEVHKIIKDSIKKGVSKIFLPSVDSSSVYKILNLTNKYPNICYPMIGFHPCYVNSNNFKKELKNLEKFIYKNSFIAIGEIGIDLFNNKNHLIEQKYVFRKQIEWSKKMKLPLIIHCRNSFNIVINILKEKFNKYKGIFHCFSGTLENAKKVIDMGMKLGIGGIITFKKNNIINFLNKIDLKNIVLETDSPYLSPHPFRGKRNEPKNIIIILEKLSKIYKLPKKEIIPILENNVKNIFF